jgi:glucose-6-phosphate isomerase
MLVLGGSYLGPDFVKNALATECEGIFTSQGFTLRFLSNVDSMDVARCISGLDAEETIVVVVSKTFTTAETMLNARTMRQWLWDRMSVGCPSPEVTARHMVACASESAESKVVFCRFIEIPRPF